MDGERFDDLARALARGTTRRRLLKGMIGGVAGEWPPPSAGLIPPPAG